MKKPLLSIVIPFQNLEHWLLERCLTSIVSQPADPAEYELIIVDDGSLVSPQPVIDSFSANRIRLYRQENRGPGGARNTGMSLSEGDYILFIDSDDYLFDNVLSSYLDILKNSKPDLLSFRFGVTYKKEREQRTQEPAVFPPPVSGAEYMIHNNIPGCVWHYIFKKTLATGNHIVFTETIYHEDEEFTTKIYFYAEQLIVSNLVAYAYYQRNNSIMNRKETSHLNKRFDNLRGVIQRLHQFEKSSRSGSNAMQKQAIERKIHLLIGDFIISMARNFCSLSYIIRETKELRACGLYPLPKRKYSLKYKLFRQLANRKSGICLLYLIELFRSKTSKL